MCERRWHRRLSHDGHGITCQCLRNKSSRTRRVARFHVAARMSKNLRERSAIDDKTFVQRSLSNSARCLALWMVKQDAPEPLNPGAARGEPQSVAASNAPCLRPAKEQPQSARDGLRGHPLGVLYHVFSFKAHASHDSGSHDRAGANRVQSYHASRTEANLSTATRKCERSHCNAARRNDRALAVPPSGICLVRLLQLSISDQPGWLRAEADVSRVHSGNRCTCVT